MDSNPNGIVCANMLEYYMVQGLNKFDSRTRLKCFVICSLFYSII